MKTNYILASLAIIISFTSCKKEEVVKPPVEQQPEMEYFDLNNREIRANHPGFLFDVNSDGRNDLAFTTLLVGDPIEEMDKLQFLILTNIGVNLPVNSKEEIPVLGKGDQIITESSGSYQWFDLASIMLVQKNTSLMQDPFWTGHWKNALNKYLPYQMIVDGKKYNGWIELSVDIIQEKIVLHKAAISKVANVNVKAGL